MSKLFVRTNARVLDDVNVGHDEDGDYAVLAENVDEKGEQGVVYELSDSE